MFELLDEFPFSIFLPFGTFCLISIVFLNSLLAESYKSLTLGSTILFSTASLFTLIKSVLASIGFEG